MALFVLPRSDQVPPLSWVRAFSEAGRQGSFKKAAAALNLSPSTVSHEIRKLEDWVGTPLFTRSGRSVSLTEEGARLFDKVSSAFDTIESAFESFAVDESSPVRIGMFPFFASEFVLPMLTELMSRTNGRTVNIGSDTHLSALNHTDSRQRVDAVIRYSSEAPKGYESFLLTNISLGIVGGRCTTCGSAVEDLNRIELDVGFNGWGALDQAGFKIPKKSGATLVVDNYLAALRAVEQGLGLGVAVLPLCASWLLDGRIHLVTQNTLAIPYGYWMIWRSSSPKADQLRSIANEMARKFEEQRAEILAMSE